MMKFWLAVVLLILTPISAFATPPRELQVRYDQLTKLLDVKMKHITIEQREHYIRTIKVAVNGAEPQVFRYTFQKYPSEFSASIPIELKAGDTIVVRAECKLGGSAQVELIIPVEPGTEQNADDQTPPVPQSETAVTPEAYDGK